MKQVAVVIIHHRSPLTPDELISVRHLKKHLSKHDQYLVFPDNLQIPNELSGIPTKLVAAKHLKSVDNFCRLVTTLYFYNLFRNYEYILFYQLDALVFSDRLSEWCDRGYDYVGAPWYYEDDHAKTNKSKYFGKVGNSGFSLHKVSSSLRVLRKYNSPFKFIAREGVLLLRLTKQFLLAATKAPFDKNVRKKVSLSEFIKQKRFEDPRNIDDYFWAFESHKYIDRFNIPSDDIAVDFSIETSPRYCFKKNNEKLPFGCHAWARYDRAFWEPHLLK